MSDPAQVLRRALAVMVYETTCLSPERDDGSHDCRISRTALRGAREALAITAPTQPTHPSEASSEKSENTR